MILLIDRFMTERGLLQPIGFLARADSVLKSAEVLIEVSPRVENIQLGVESFLDEQLVRYQKGISARMNLQAIEFLRQQEIIPEIYLILGDLKTTKEEVRQIINFLKRNPRLFTLLLTVSLMEDHLLTFNDYPEWLKIIAKNLSNFGHDGYWNSAKSFERFMSGLPLDKAEQDHLSKQISSLEHILAF